MVLVERDAGLEDRVDVVERVRQGPLDDAALQPREEAPLDLVERVVEDLAQILRAGINVVSSSMVMLVYPECDIAEFIEPIRAACDEGKVSFLTTGIDPGFANAWFQLAFSQVSLFEWNRISIDEARALAEPALARALELDPDYPTAHFNLALVLRAQGELEQAILHLRRAVELAPGYTKAREHLDRALAERRNRGG